MGIKEGSPRKHTQSVQRPLPPPGPGSQGPFEKKRSRCSFLKKSNKKALCENFFTVFVEPMAFACVFLLFENAARKKCFYTWSSRVFFHLNTLVGSKKLFCWLIFVHVFTVTISLKGALFTCTYESNQSIEWTNRINEWKQWIEALNRTNESNQWIESLSRETRQEAVTIHIKSPHWFATLNSKPPFC